MCMYQKSAACLSHNECTWKTPGILATRVSFVRREWSALASGKYPCIWIWVSCIWRYTCTKWTRKANTHYTHRNFNVSDHVIIQMSVECNSCLNFYEYIIEKSHPLSDVCIDSSLWMLIKTPLYEVEADFCIQYTLVLLSYFMFFFIFNV